MRVAIVFDMEGTSHIRDYRELYPIYPEYWRSGRKKLTNDVTAAAVGLIDGGATEIVVINHHGAGEVEWPNVISERLPSGVWCAAVPLIGMVGSEALGLERGSLADVPFLAVQASNDRVTAKPTRDDPDATAAAIRAFARGAIERGGTQHPRRPRAAMLEASLQNGEQAAEAMESAGWTRTSETEFRLPVEDWQDRREPLVDAIWAAAGAAWTPYAFAFDGVDPSTEATALGYEPDAFERTDAFVRAWTNDRMVEWIAPGSVTRLEGMDIELA